MADIELVIKISEEEYINIKNAINSLIENGIKRASMSKVCLAILDGTPLPKEHGRIVDIGKIDKDRIERDNPVIYLTVNGEYIEAVSLDYLNALPSIIDAEEFRCKAEESEWQDASACKDCQNKCDEYHQWDKEMKK